MMDFKKKYQGFVNEVNDYLNQCISRDDIPQSAVYSSMRYSIEAGGKRLRPVLALAVCELLDGSIHRVMPFACAVEMIHTYSLIHDDLPSMDNDEYRRGKLTNHMVYGEAMAILAGDALLNLAFETMLKAAVSNTKALEENVKAMKIIASSSGAEGMIGGQVIDLESEGKSISSDLLERMHKRKTGALIKAPVIASAILCGANEKEQEYLELFSDKLGLAFQVKDDILDVEGNSDKLGKKIGSDEANQKSTFVSIYGIDKAKSMLDNLTEDAIGSLKYFGEKAGFLTRLANYLLIREN